MLSMAFRVCEFLQFFLFFFVFFYWCLPSCCPHVTVVSFGVVDTAAALTQLLSNAGDCNGIKVSPTGCDVAPLAAYQTTLGGWELLHRK